MDKKNDGAGTVITTQVLVIGYDVITVTDL